MNKFFFILLTLLPVTSFSADFSDCEVIGHKIYTESVEKCTTPPEACNEDPDSSLCVNNIKTEEQCIEEIKNINNLMAENYLVFKCPATSERVAQKGGDKVTTTLNYVYNDGTAVDADAMLEDEESVYIFRMGKGLLGILKYTEEYQDYILGPKAKNDMNLAEFK